MIKSFISLICVFTLSLGGQQLFAKTYKVDRQIDLKGKTWTLGENDLLVFDEDGSLSNGVVEGDNVYVRANKKVIFINMVLKGSFKAEVAYSEWFGIKGDCELNEEKTFVSGTDHTTAFTNLFLFDNIEIAQGFYMTRGVLRCRNNQTINGHGATIKSLNKGICIKIDGSKSVPIRNVIIKNLNIVGGKNDFNDKTEFWEGIEIGYARNIVVENVTAEFCRGDGFYIGTGIGNEKDNRIPQNIQLINVRAYHNYRQGLSITRAKKVRIRNSEFCYTAGTPPQRGIDIEPNCSKCDDGTWNVGTCEDIVIDSCLFKGNAVAGIVLFKVPDVIDQNTFIIKNVTIKNSSFDDDDIFIEGGKNIKLENLTLKNSVIGIIEKSALNNLTISHIIMEENKLIKGRNAIEFGYAENGALRKNIIIKNVSINGFGGGIVIRDGAKGSTPQYKNIDISNCRISNCQKGVVKGSNVETIKERRIIVTNNLLSSCSIRGILILGAIGVAMTLLNYT